VPIEFDQWIDGNDHFPPMGQKYFETPGGKAEKPQHRSVTFRIQEKATDEAGNSMMIISNNKTQNDD
jgi:hypothetical protein